MNRHASVLLILGVALLVVGWWAIIGPKDESIGVPLIFLSILAGVVIVASIRRGIIHWRKK